MISSGHIIESLILRWTSGTGNTVIGSEVNALSHPLAGLPTVSLIVYVLSVVFEVLVNVILLWNVLYVCTIFPLWSSTSNR